MNGNDPSLGGIRSQRTGAEPGLSVDALLPRLIDALNSADLDIRNRAIEALGRTHDPRAVPPLLDALRSKDKELRYIAANALGMLGKVGYDAVADLLDVLDQDAW